MTPKTYSIRLRRTIVVRTDVKTSSLASCDSLRQTKQRSPQCPNAIFEKDRPCVHGGSGAGDLDAEPIFGNADLLELASVAASMCNDFLGIICVERRGLYEHPPLNVVDILGAKENALHGLCVSLVAKYISDRSKTMNIRLCPGLLPIPGLCIPSRLAETFRGFQESTSAR